MDIEKRIKALIKREKALTDSIVSIIDTDLHSATTLIKERDQVYIERTRLEDVVRNPPPDNVVYL